jgi:hypothetical protein
LAVISGSKPKRFSRNVGCDPLDRVAGEHFVAGLHVGQIQIGEAIGQRGKYAIAYIMPEVEHALTVTGEPAAEHGICLVLDNRLQ